MYEIKYKLPNIGTFKLIKIGTETKSLLLGLLLIKCIIITEINIEKLGILNNIIFNKLHFYLQCTCTCIPLTIFAIQFIIHTYNYCFKFLCSVYCVFSQFPYKFPQTPLFCLTIILFNVHSVLLVMVAIYLQQLMLISFKSTPHSLSRILQTSKVTMERSVLVQIAMHVVC